MVVISAQIESGFVAKDDLVPFYCSPISSCVAPLKRMRRWVGVKGSTRNGRHNPKCPSSRHLRMSVNAKDPEPIADFGTRPMGQNFDVFTLKEMLRVYSNTVSSYALSEGALTQDNAKDLAMRYVDIMEKQAKKNVKQDDPTSKYPAIGDGILEFFKSVSTVDVDKVWKIAIYFGSEWLLTAAETSRSTS
ncbi:uncharacterized protein TNCV_2396651 [Trichonephila clavipes]|uniref:Uncharacterized protein n=1 Tax=Trichonephila clavipes TaxID=2585209 RepID=A0A8X6SR47_TRICX|nr:uncharacterized protein TNCV_2396651 [Trichonephila clavipes]